MAYSAHQLEAMKKQFGAKGSEQAKAGISNYDLYMQQQNASKPSTPSYTQPSTPSYSAPKPQTPSYSQSYETPSYREPTYREPSYSQGPSVSYDAPVSKPQAPALKMPDITGLTQQTIAEIQKKAAQGISLVKPTDQKQAIYDWALQNAKGANTQDKGYSIQQNTNGQWGSAGWTPPNLFAPGESAKQSAGFNGSNWGDMSGVYLGNANTGDYRQVSHQEATANNPLHPVNANRNQLILDAMNSGDWSKYNQFEAGQSPGWYTDGQKNKEYYARLIETAVNSGNEARIKELIPDLMNAPGLMPSIAKFNSSDAWAKQYGVPQADTAWFNSAANNPQVRQDGRYEQNMWYDNAVFQNDPGLLSNVLSINNSYGDADEQKLRQQINAGAFSSPQTQQQAPQQQAPDQYAQLQAEFDAQMKAMMDMLEQMKKDAENKNAYKDKEVIDANKGGSGSGGSGGGGSHVFAPGTDITEGGVGWTQSKNSLNDALFKYLDEMWQGGF